MKQTSHKPLKDPLGATTRRLNNSVVTGPSNTIDALIKIYQGQDGNNGPIVNLDKMLQNQTSQMKNSRQDSRKKNLKEEGLCKAMNAYVEDDIVFMGDE